MQYLSVNSVSINVAFVHSAIAKLSCEQQEIDALLIAANIPPALLTEPQARVSLYQYAQLVTSLITTTEDEMLGHTHQPIPIGSFSLLAHWIAGAKSIEQAISRLSRFYDIVNRQIDINVTFDDTRFVLEIGNTSHHRDSDEFVCEFIFFFVHRILCWLLRRLLPIAEIAFPFDKPSHAKDHRLMYYGAPIFYAQTKATIAFPKKLLTASFNKDAKMLKTLLDNPIGSLLMLNFHEESWSSKVGNIAQSKLSNMPSLPEVAEQMGIQPYTLQRRLKKEGVTYLDIKNQIKRDTAIELLTNSDLSIEAISTRVGFVETSPFTRTFKQWTGVPPSAYRKRKR